MPPFLDVYGLTRQRNRVTVDRFLDVYVDRDRSEDRAGEEREVYRPMYPGSLKKLTSRWEPSISLANLVEKGLDCKDCAFSVYLQSRYPKTRGALLAFTIDGMLVLGLAVDDPMGRPEPLQIARKLLKQITAEFDCHLGFIGAEHPPPLSESDFRNPIQTVIATWPR
jgi:hypothetical protein